MKVLLVEDDPGLASVVKTGLGEQGIQVVTVATYADAEIKAALGSFDVLILDVMLPGGSGFDLCRQLRARGVATPILMLTARDTVDDRVTGLEVGADDYLTKPFAMTELLARLRAVLRRIRPSLAEDVITVGNIEMDRGAHRVRRAGREVHLGPTEYKLLDHLIQHPGRVFSREQLLDAVWGSDVYVETRTVDVHVGRLRKALNIEGVNDPIRTVRSAGYSLDRTASAVKADP
jgi:two-component system, OmpR family, phosphate regulon response regulator PhoB